MSRQPSRMTIETDLGTEIQCAKCKEFWPCDPEFFFFQGGRPHSWCKACYADDPKVKANRARAVQRLADKRRSQRGAAA